MERRREAGEESSTKKTLKSNPLARTFKLKLCRSAFEHNILIFQNYI